MSIRRHLPGIPPPGRRPFQQSAPGAVHDTRGAPDDLVLPRHAWTHRDTSHPSWSRRTWHNDLSARHLSHAAALSAYTNLYTHHHPPEALELPPTPGRTPSPWSNRPWPCLMTRSEYDHQTIFRQPTKDQRRTVTRARLIPCWPPLSQQHLRKPWAVLARKTSQFV